MVIVTWYGLIQYVGGKKMMDGIIVGAGLYGATVARELKVNGKTILVDCSSNN
jgi:hypothetical protein